jgi:hypothetical protein
LTRTCRPSPCWTMSAAYIQAVPTINLPDDELAAVTAAIRRAIEDDRFPHAPRLDPLRAALAKLDATSELTPLPTARRQSRQAGARRNRWERLSKLSVIDHHFDQFGDLVAREVTRIGDKGLRIRRVDIRNSPFRSAVTGAGYNDVSERR